MGPQTKPKHANGRSKFPDAIPIPLRIYSFCILAIFLSFIGDVDSDDMFSDVKDLLWTNSTRATVLGNPEEIHQFIAQNYSLLYFGTYGCKHCDQVEAALITMAEERGEIKHMTPDHHQYLPIAVVNVHDHPELARQIKVHRVPTLRLYHQGLYRTIPQGESHKGFIEHFVDQRIHLKKLPEIYNADRLDEVVKNVPHALVWVGDGAHKIDHAAKKLLRYLQFSLSHFHFYLMKDEKLAKQHNLKPHSLYEVSSIDRQWKRIDIHSALTPNSSEVDMSHFNQVKRKVLSIAHPKVQMMDLIFLHKFGQEDVLMFYSTDQGNQLRHNQALQLFNDTCHSHLYMHTRCAIFCADANMDVRGLTHIFHLPISSLTSNMIVHFHTHNLRRETYIMSGGEELTDKSLMEFYHDSHSRKLPQLNVKRGLLWEYSILVSGFECAIYKYELHAKKSTNSDESYLRFPHWTPQHHVLSSTQEQVAPDFKVVC